MSNQNINPPSPWLFMTEVSRSIFNFGTFFISIPFLQLTPYGDGHPVLVLPGFLTTDNTTLPLRYFLLSRGYTAKPWELGRNMVNYDVLEKKIIETVIDLHKKYKSKVSLIGWSAGGVMARAIANDVPEYVRQVITMGSPFNGIKNSTNLETILEIVTGKHPSEMDKIVLERAAPTPPVPTTAIFTKLDGIVAWETCVESLEDEKTENVEVYASHLGLGFDPMTLLCIADRLAQPEDNWIPFKNTPAGKMFYSLSGKS
jgi:pimeloyl-ACP methyl ester carboxylesterase